MATYDNDMLQYADCHICYTPMKDEVLLQINNLISTEEAYLAFIHKVISNDGHIKTSELYPEEYKYWVSREFLEEPIIKFQRICKKKNY